MMRRKKNLHIFMERTTNPVKKEKFFHTRLDVIYVSSVL